MFDFVVEDGNHFVVEIVWNQIDDIAYDGDVTVVDDVVVIDVVVAVVVVTVVVATVAVVIVGVVVVVDGGERMIEAEEMYDDFVRLVLVVKQYHLIALLNES